MRKFIIFFILVLVAWANFAQVDIKRQGYYQVIVADTVYSQHSQEYQAIEQMINLSPTVASVKAPSLVVNWKAITDTIVKEIPVYYTDTVTIVKEIPVYYTDTVFIGTEQGILVNGKRYFSEEVVAMYPEKEIDTLDVTECFEDYNKKVWLYPVGDSQVGGQVWIPFRETGLSLVEVDSMPIWKKKFQNKYRLQRTKNHVTARTTYKELEMPFQFMHDSIVSIGSEVVQVRAFANEDWYPILYVDDQLWEDGSENTPGYQDLDGFESRRHTITFNGLLPDKEYTLKVVGHSRLRKEEISIYYQIKTSP